MYPFINHNQNDVISKMFWKNLHTLFYTLSKKMRKEMILRGLSEDETFSKICENEDVKRLMEKLSSEV